MKHRKVRRHVLAPLGATAEGEQKALGDQMGNRGAPQDSRSFAASVASAIANSHVVLRARALRRLLMPVGPLALAVLAGGAFAKYLPSARWSRFSISLDDAARMTTSQIEELVRYVEQSNPAVLERVMTVVSRDATTMATLSASVAALAIRMLARSKSPGTRNKR